MDRVVACLKFCYDTKINGCYLGIHLFLVWLVIYDQVLCTVLYRNCSAYVNEDLNAPLFIYPVIKHQSL